MRTTLPIHPSGHPPGPTVLLGGLYEVGLRGVWGETVMILLVGSLTAVPVYLLGCELADEPSARLAVLAWLFAPNVLLMSATSMDAVFAAVSTVAAVLLLRRRAVAGGLATAAASFLSYALLAVPVWAVATLLLRGTRPRALLPRVCVALAVIAGCYLLLWLLTGYQPYDAYQATKHAYETGVSGRRPLWFWFFGDIAVFLLGLGLPGLVLWSRALGRLDSAAVALAGTLLLASASGFAKAEVERIWLFMIPLAAVSIGPQLLGRRLRPLLMLLVAAGAAGGASLRDDLVASAAVGPDRGMCGRGMRRPRLVAPALPDTGSTRVRTWVDPDTGVLLPGPGEPLRNRTELAPRSRPTRRLVTFAQLADAHVTDEESPARVEVLDRLGAAVHLGVPAPGGADAVRARRRWWRRSTGCTRRQSSRPVT